MEIFNEVELEKFINESVQIDKSRIEDELVEYPAKYGWFLVLYEKARTRRERLKFELDVLWGNLYRRYKDEKGRTEKQVEALIMTTSEYIDKFNEYLDAREREMLIYAVVRVLEAKKDLLISYVSLVRDERRGYFEVERQYNGLKEI